MTIPDYISKYSTPPDEYLTKLYRATWLHLLYPRMASDPVQGQLLKMLMQIVRPKIVVEIGTFSGYSALAMASGMDEGSSILTFEKNDEQAAFTSSWFKKSPYPAQIKMIVGDVFSLLPSIKPDIDVAYIDANKREYCAYFDLVMPFTHKGSLIIADNTLWDGHVVDATYDNDAQTLGIRRFNEYVANDSRVEQVIIAERDGFSLIRVL